MTDERDPLRERERPTRQEPEERPGVEDVDEAQEPETDAEAEAAAERDASQAEADDEGEVTPV